MCYIESDLMNYQPKGPYMQFKYSSSLDTQLIRVYKICDAQAVYLRQSLF